MVEDVLRNVAVLHAGLPFHPVHALDLLYADDQPVQLAEMFHLDAEIAVRHSVRGVHRGVGDVDAGIGDRPGDLVQQPGPVRTEDAQPDDEELVLLHVPVYLEAPFQVVHDVRAFLVMHRHAPSAGDEADDRIARDRLAALREADHQVVDARDLDPAPGPAHPVHEPRQYRRFGRFFFVRLLRKQSLGDLGRGILPASDRGIEAVRVGQPVLLREGLQFVGDLPLDLEALQLPVQQVFAEADTLFQRGLSEPRPDLGRGLGRLHDIQPVRTRRLVRGSENGNRVAVVQLPGQRRDVAVHLRTAAVESDVGMDGEGEVQHARALRKFLEIPARGEDEDGVVVQVHAQVTHELLGIGHVGLPVQRLAEPVFSALAFLDLVPSFLVEPVGGDPHFRDPVHFPRADLDLGRFSVGRDDRGVQGLVHVHLGTGNVVFESIEDGGVEGMDDPERVVAVGQRVGHDAQRQQVVDLLERPVAALHLRVDAVEMLCPAVHRGVDAGVLQGLDDGLADLVDQLFPFRTLLVQLAREIPVDVGRQVFQAEVFQFGLDLGHAEPVGEGRVDLPRFEGDPLLLLRFQKGQRPHVVEPVRELDEDDAHILRHGNEHLAEILGLEFLLASEGQPGDLGDAVHQDGHFLAEFRGQLFDGHFFHVFHHVVQEPRRDRHGVQLQADQRKHHLRAVHHEGLAGLADLAGVVQGAEMIGPLDEVELGFQRLVGSRSPDGKWRTAPAVPGPERSRSG